MTDLSLATNLIFVLAAAFIGGSLATVFRQPPIVGYILGGLLFGPQAIGLIRDTNEIRTLAEIGVAFLMFTLGLEFPLSRLQTHSKVVVLGVVIQLLVSSVSALLLVGILSIDLTVALFLGVLLGFSSTAVVVKSLMSRGELATTHGELASSWLILQDLAVLPTLVILSSLGGGSLLLDLGSGVAKAAVFLVAAVYLGTRFVPRILSQVASGSREVFMLAAFLLVVGVAFVTRYAGLSFALGGFLAGLIIAESPFKEQLFADVKNIRDLFATLFFVSIGMLVGPVFLLQHIFQIVILLLIMASVKLAVVVTWIYKFGYHLKTALLVGLALLQIGEFSFIVANLGLEKGFISGETYQLVLATALVSLLATPFLVSRSSSIYHVLNDTVLKRLPAWHHLFSTHEASQPPHLAEVPLENHIVVVGYGRVGRYLSHALLSARIPQIVSDLDPRKLVEPASSGIPTVYGDAAEEEILDLMNVRQARAVVVTHGEVVGTKLTIHRVRQLAPQMKILARASSDEDVADLRSLAVYRVIQPEFEASLTMTHKVLDFLGLPKVEIEALLKRLRHEHHS